MADSKEIVSSSVSSWTPEFIRELLPAAERTALLYHLSYLCLGGFPKLERLIRERALETQLLFKSSVVVLLECVITSSTLVFSLLPSLLMAVEHNEPSLAVKYLGEIRAKINDIIIAVEDIVKRYDEHNQSVASCTSDVFQEKTETEKQLTQTTEEIKSLEEAVANLEEELRKRAENINEIQKTIEEKNNELQNRIRDASSKNIGFGILTALVPFTGAIVSFIDDAVTGPGDAAQTQALNAELSRLMSEKSSLQKQESSIQVKLTDLQMQLANCKIRLGVIPSPVHLVEVQKCLSQIQQILVQLQKFWEKVGSLLDTLKEKTFVNEDLIEHLSDLKQEFVTSIEEAEKCWQRFGECCQRAQVIFSVQSKDAYKFLEMNPSSLSKDEWDEQHKSIIEKLNQISPQEMLMI
ncbi:restin homolog [Cyprinus carpio]|uniref:Restin homolog n=1 Tax=Cyprinus carpio TaxID=7962 RepID=A0A9Q9V1G5_CYPCA|nr:restin homolog [Cyprinus carpio]